MLHQCRLDGAYVDCYRIESKAPPSLPNFIEAFYSSQVFKLERRILAVATGKAATDHNAHTLAQDETRQFSIWRVEGRNQTEVLLSTGRTRSWLMVASSLEPGSPGSTLLVGSAVFPASNPGTGMGLPFQALLGFHKLYSRALLASAATRMSTLQKQDREGNM